MHSMTATPVFAGRTAQRRPDRTGRRRRPAGTDGTAVRFRRPAATGRPAAGDPSLSTCGRMTPARLISYHAVPTFERASDLADPAVPKQHHPPGR